MTGTVGIGTSGVLVNQYNQVLLILRDDTRTWAPPGGALMPHELPDAATAREVREESGLIVMPVRLVSVHFTPFQPIPLLGFTFRCIQRGGELQPSEESPRVGFFAANELPRRIAGFHRLRLDNAMTHAVEAAVWFTTPLTWQTRLVRQLLLKVIYPLKDWRRQRNGQQTYEPPELWQTLGFTVIQNEAGEVLWSKTGELWQLPGGLSAEQEPPWETAVRHTRLATGLDVSLTQLSGVYVSQSGPPKMSFVFTAVVAKGQPNPNSQYFLPGQEPEQAAAPHLQQIQHATAKTNITFISHQSE